METAGDWQLDMYLMTIPECYPLVGNILNSCCYWQENTTLPLDHGSVDSDEVHMMFWEEISAHADICFLLQFDDYACCCTICVHDFY